MLILQNNIIGSAVVTEGVLGVIVSTFVSLSSSVILHKNSRGRRSIIFCSLQDAVQRGQDKAGHIILHLHTIKALRSILNTFFRK